MKAEAQCAADVPKYPFDERPVHVMRCMHVPPNLLHGVADVRMHQSEILSHIDNVATLSAGLPSAADN